MEDDPDGSASPPLQPVRINWQTPDDLNELNKPHVEIDLDYDIDKPWSPGTGEGPFEVEGQDVSIADMFLLRSLDPQTNWTAAKASEYFTPLLIDIAGGSSPASDDAPPNIRATEYSSFHRQSKFKVRRRLGLPLVFVGGSGPTTVLTCPDSGSDWNVMAFETAGTLGYPIELHGDSDSTQFVLANGGTVNSIGKISAKCAFTTGASVSYQYAKTRFSIEPASEAVMFADGSIDHTCGVLRTSFTVGHVADDSEFVARGKTLSLNFYVLDGLTSDILVGQDTLEALNVFAGHTASFIPDIPRLGGSDINIIQLISNFESSTRDKLRDSGRWVSNVLGRNTDLAQTSTTMSPEQRLDLEDQRENARAESPTSVTNGFQCTFPNCNAPPFATQYLLNSHANVHSRARPYYCPVSGCRRSLGGNGFKRKDEMIRHGLVHASPGYTCPFCTDREHKYPRPDNLQRHVRVHHVDKDKDDPLLRQVLSQHSGRKNRRSRW